MESTRYGPQAQPLTCASLPRGKRRGDCQRLAELEADYQLHVQNGSGNNEAGDCCNFMDAVSLQNFLTICTWCMTMRMRILKLIINSIKFKGLIAEYPTKLHKFSFTL